MPSSEFCIRFLLVKTAFTLPLDIRMLVSVLFLLPGKKILYDYHGFFLIMTFFCYE